MYKQFGKQTAKQKRMLVPVQGETQVEFPGGGCAKQWACLKVNRCDVWKEFVGQRGCHKGFWFEWALHEMEAPIDILKELKTGWNGFVSWRCSELGYWSM